jgi:hypothetical protein
VTSYQLPVISDQLPVISSVAPDEENAAAYKLWKPKPTESEQISPEQFQEFMRSLRSSFSLRQAQGKAMPKSQSEIEELNNWIRNCSDPQY